MIEFYDFIQFAFEYDHPDVMIELEIFHFDLGGLESSFLPFF
jgi:hypothetical protein